MRLEMFTFLFISSSAFFSVPLSSSKFCLMFLSLCNTALNAGLIGLALAYSLSLIMNFQYCVVQSADVESLVCLLIVYNVNFCFR